jgi:hypothetical protein
MQWLKKFFLQNKNHYPITENKTILTAPRQEYDRLTRKKNKCSDPALWYCQVDSALQAGAVSLIPFIKPLNLF